MSDYPDLSSGPGAQRPQAPGAGLEPLPGEAGIPNVATAQRPAHSLKGLLSLALMVLTLIIITAYSIHSYFVTDPHADKAAAKRTADRPSAAAAEPKKLDFTLAGTSQPPQPPQPPQLPRIPALIPTDDELAEPIGVRRSPTSNAGSGPGSGPGSARGAAGGPQAVSPEDAPIMLLVSRGQLNPGAEPRTEGPRDAASADRGDTVAQPDPLQATKRNLQGYQHQLQGLLETLTRSTALMNGASGTAGSGSGMSTSTAAPLPPARLQPPAAGLFGGQLQGSVTPRTSASQLGDRSLTLAKGTAFTCALKTRIISAASGLVGCQVLRHVYSDDGRVLLLERGSHLDGEYRITAVRPGTVRIPVLWTRIRTPLGVTVDIDSPGTGPLGESGVDGQVDNRWSERIGAAMLMSLIDDSVKWVIQNQTGRERLDGNSTVILPSTTANTSKLAEKVLDSTINIPPLIYQNQGGIVGIYVARDVDFSSVYALRAVAP